MRILVLGGDGMLGHRLLKQRPQVLAGRLPGTLRPLAVLGTWSLTFYMVHQPLLIGAIKAWRWTQTGHF